MADYLLIGAVVGAMVLLTFVVARTLGRRLARRSRVLASLVSALLPSIVLTLVAIMIFLHDVDVRNDGPAMALTGSLIYAVLALPFTVVIAVLTIGRRKTG